MNKEDLRKLMEDCFAKGRWSATTDSGTWRVDMYAYITSQLSAMKGEGENVGVRKEDVVLTIIDECNNYREKYNRATIPAKGFLELAKSIADKIN